MTSKQSMYQQLELFPPPYEPEVDDYVIWKNPYGDNEGWVYFKCPPSEPPKKGYTTPQRYITIETSIRPKPKEQLAENGTDRHKFIHTLLLCYESEWKNLIFVKRRESNVIQHWSQYDDISGNDH